MELIVISQNKLKIMLDEADMQHYEIRAEEMDEATTKARRAFWHILDDARQETGFNAADDKLYVQLYPSRKGGCEIFVTKLGLVSPSPINGAPLPGKGHPPPDINLHPKSESTHKPWQSGAFRFSSLSVLLQVCARLCAVGYRGKSAAYSDGDCAYLFLSVFSPAYAPLDAYTFLYEYGTQENAEILLLWLSEHAKPICTEKAAEVLGALGK